MVADYKEYRISINNNLVGLEKVTEQKELIHPENVQAARTEALAEKTAKMGSTSKAIAIHMGRQALNYALSNYGNLTGDHITQARISETLELAGLIAMAASGPVGMVAAAGNVAIKAFNRYIDVRKSEIQANALKVRTGGSRNEN